MFGVVTKVDFMGQAFVLMTERAVSAIDKRTDSGNKFRLAGIHFEVDRFTLRFINEKGTGSDV